MKLISTRVRSLEELWAIEDEFPAVCGPSPVAYASRHGLRLSKGYLTDLSRRKVSGQAAFVRSRRRKPLPA